MKQFKTVKIIQFDMKFEFQIYFSPKQAIRLPEPINELQKKNQSARINQSASNYT